MNFPIHPILPDLFEQAWNRYAIATSPGTSFTREYVTGGADNPHPVDLISLTARLALLKDMIEKGVISATDSAAIRNFATMPLDDAQVNDNETAQHIKRLTRTNPGQ